MSDSIEYPGLPKSLVERPSVYLSKRVRIQTNKEVTSQEVKTNSERLEDWSHAS